MRWALSKMQRGDHFVLKCNEEEMWAVGWHDHHYKCYLTTHGTDLLGKPAPRKDKTLTPTQIIASTYLAHKLLQKYQHEIDWVDRHNRYRQGILGLHTVWTTTKRWQTRIQLVFPSLTLFLLVAICFLSGVWKKKLSKMTVCFGSVCVRALCWNSWIKHQDMNEIGKIPGYWGGPFCKLRSDERWDMRLGEKKIATGINRGVNRTIQGRCTSCRARNKKQDKRDRAPNTLPIPIVHGVVFVILVNTFAKTKLAGLSICESERLELIMK